MMIFHSKKVWYIKESFLVLGYLQHNPSLELDFQILFLMSGLLPRKAFVIAKFSQIGRHLLQDSPFFAYKHSLLKKVDFLHPLSQ